MLDWCGMTRGAALLPVKAAGDGGGSGLEQAEGGDGERSGDESH